MKKKIAITGGIGSGKSTALEHIRSLGYPVFSCDSIYEEISKEDSYLEKVENMFPGTVVDGKLDRKQLSDIVFSNQELRDKLNDLSHQLIMARLFEKMSACEEEYVFAEVPLLFEGGYEKDFDGVIVLMRNVNKRIQAVMERDKKTKEEVGVRISVQFDYNRVEEKARRSKTPICIIYNDEEVESLKDQLSQCIQDFKAIVKLFS